MAGEKREIQRSTVNKTNKSRLILPNHFRVSRSDCKCFSTEMRRPAGPRCRQPPARLPLRRWDGQPDREGWMDGWMGEEKHCLAAPFGKGIHYSPNKICLTPKQHLYQQWETSGWDRPTRNPIAPARSHCSPLSGDIPCKTPLNCPIAPSSHRLSHGGRAGHELSVALPVHYPAETYSQTFRNRVASVDAT